MGTKSLISTFTTIAATSLSLISAPAYSAYDDAGTAYTTQTAEEWTEDSANELITLANSFACIIKNSRGDLSQHVNGNWQALIDETACGLAEDNSQGGKSLAKAILTSSRASNTSPQEVTAWFNASGNDRYIANVTITSTADDVPPFGAWYFSFFKERAGANGTSVNLETSNLGSTDNGFTKISQSGSDVLLEIAELYKDGGISQKQEAVITIVDGNTDTVKFLGKTTTNGAVTGMAGQTDSDYYFKATVNSSGAVNDSACLSRSNQWANNFAYKLYNANTGAAISLDAGYGFETDDGVRGYVGSWGIWFDDDPSNDDDGNPFSPSNTYVSATKNSDDSAVTLYWSPGQLFSRNATTETMSDGDSFRWWGEVSNQFDEYFATWDDTNNHFNLTDSDSNSVGTLTTAAINLSPHEGWLWSDLKRTSVYWDGNASGEISFDVKSKTDATSAESSATSTTFRCTDATCPGAASGSMTLTDWVDNGYGRDDFFGGSTNDYYFYTGKEPGSGFLPFTMYHDTDDSETLTSSDVPIRFNFKIAHDDTYTDFSDNSTGTFSGNWPQVNFDFIKHSELGVGDCSLGSPGDCTQYEWSTGAYSHDNDVMLYDASDEGTALDAALVFNYTYSSGSDVNDGIGLTFETESDYNPVKSLCSESGGTFSCSSVEPSDLDGRKFLLEFDGENLHGLPGVDAVGGNNTMWLQLVNLADGTSLTDTNGTSYVVKATEIGYSFTSVGDAACVNAGIDFGNVSEIDLSMDSVPDLTDNDNYPRPIDTDWSDIVTVDTTSCDVVQGVATCP